ncbi:MAG: hypothetical protein A2W28_08030 [Gammaproteobacteria bacterium RBG_16_51_14]|nr:MAG: hypothetical protein A2W28_08030 [Gammaproteobacteria bacterium RBG_16_51_14]
MRPVPFLERSLRYPLEFAVEFADAIFQVLPAGGLFRDQHDGIALFANENFVVLKAKLFGQPHCLAIALLEYFGCFHDDALLMCIRKSIHVLTGAIYCIIQDRFKDRAAIAAVAAIKVA